MQEKFIEFVISVLDDCEGISESSYNLLLDMSQADGVLPELREQVLRYVDAASDRFWLPKDWNE